MLKKPTSKLKNLINQFSALLNTRTTLARSSKRKYRPQWVDFMRMDRFEKHFRTIMKLTQTRRRVARNVAAAVEDVLAWRSNPIGPRVSVRIAAHRYRLPTSKVQAEIKKRTSTRGHSTSGRKRKINAMEGVVDKTLMKFVDRCVQVMEPISLKRSNCLLLLYSNRDVLCLRFEIAVMDSD